MGEALRCWFPQAFGEGSSLPTSERFRHAFCGALALADWVGSDRRTFKFVAEFDPKYWPKAQKIAAELVREIGLAPGGRGLSNVKVEFARISPHLAPNSAQVATGNAPADAQLVILESETGSGKTEAALWRYAILRAARQVESLYFAVPTRTAASQLFKRVDVAMKRLFDTPPEVVLAVPGQIRAGQAKGRRLPDWEVLWDDDAGAERSQSRWASEHATRYLAAEIAVGTVDQAMMAALKVKHAHLRGFALSRALLVIDEVHASDAYMRHILQRLLKEHLAIGGHALLMSATLGSTARAGFLCQSAPSKGESLEVPYPAVWVQGEESPRPVAGQSERDKSVLVQTQSGWCGQDAATLAIAAAQEGARVLVIRNTVARAQETFDAVCAELPSVLMQVSEGPALHHSRFAAEDRVLLDRRVEAVLGQERDGQDGCVVIGTQTLEQSLDIDADILITDLCPMDVLLQRVGRLHRHDRSRPDGFVMARTVVLCPAGGLSWLINGQENGLGAFKKSGSLQGVYVDLAGLQAVLEEIERCPEWEIPAMSRSLVEAATHPVALAEIASRQGWEMYQRRVTGQELAKAGMAGLVELDRTVSLPEAYPDDEKIRTRLGDDGLVLRFDPHCAGPFGQGFSRMALPVHWSHGLRSDEVVSAEIEQDEVTFEVDGSQFLYGRRGLMRL